MHSLQKQWDRKILFEQRTVIYSHFPSDVLSAFGKKKKKKKKTFSNLSAPVAKLHYRSIIQTGFPGSSLCIISLQRFGRSPGLRFLWDDGGQICGNRSGRDGRFEVRRLTRPLDAHACLMEADRSVSWTSGCGFGRRRQHFAKGQREK